MFSFDALKSLLHRFLLGLTGGLTEHINWGGSVGYLFNTGSSNDSGRFLWNMNLTHNLTERTTHSLSVGEMFFTNDVVNEALTSRYISYRVTHSFARNLQFSMFAQVSDRENAVNGRVNTPDAYERAGGGATLSYKPLDFTSMSASILHDTSLKPQDLYSRWVSRVALSQQLSMRLTGSLIYQYEENSNRQGGFTEHMIQLGLRRYF